MYVETEKLLRCLLLVCWLHKSVGIILRHLQVPLNATEGDRPRLICSYDLDGAALYSVKWYKDGVEIYRFVPTAKKPVRSFPMDGVHINLEESTPKSITLKTITKGSSGRYRCEVSSEGPKFHTQMLEKPMFVKARTLPTTSGTSCALPTFVLIVLTSCLHSERFLNS